MNDVIFYHHGIKGQKWGIRRFQNKDGSLTAAGKKRYDDFSVRNDRENMYKNVRNLSVEDIQKQINRLQLEKTLKDSINQDLHPARTAVTNFLKSTGGKVAISAVSGAAVYAIRVALTKKFDPAEFANYVAPNPNKKK